MSSASPAGACTGGVVIASPNDTQTKSIISRANSQLSALIDTKVQNICASMEIDSEIDNICRKRSSTLTPDSQGGSKARKPSSNVSIVSSDSSPSTTPNKAQYSTTNNSSFVVHVYSTNNDSAMSVSSHCRYILHLLAEFFRRLRTPTLKKSRRSGAARFLRQGK